MIIPIENKSDDVLTIMLEPWTPTVDVQPGQVAELIMPTPPDAGELQFDYHSDRFLAIWVPPDATISIRKEQ
jgi:hypothetical protein